MLHRLKWLPLALALAGAPAPALAQGAGSYPDRPVRLVVAFPPGGATDTFIRQLTVDIQNALGQSIVIENRGGGGGYIAWQAVAQSPPDGYTLLVAENALGISQALYRGHSSGFDPLKQYDAIAGLANSPLALAVATNVPANSMKEFIAWSKSLPQRMNYASAGTGSVAHLTMEVVLDGAGIPAVHVPYKGGGPAIADVVAGHVPANMAAVAVAKSLTEGGKIKSLAVTSTMRSPALPNVPTLKEQGVKHADVDLQFWWGIFGPKGIPEPVRAKIEKAFQTVMTDPKVKERLLKVDNITDFIPGKALQAKLENEIKNWSRFIDEKGIKVAK
jgi:tripartite-type tricarboxylate transporter receptor subunit TctC